MNLDCFQKRGGKGDKRKISPDIYPKEVIWHPDWWIWKFLFFLASSISVFRKNPPVLVNRIGPVQLLGFPGVHAIRPLQLKLSSNTILLCISWAKPLPSSALVQRLHPGGEMKSGIAKDGHLCYSLGLEPYSPFIPSEQQGETWMQTEAENTQRGKGEKHE